MANKGPVVDAEYVKQIQAARNELKAIITSKQCAPVMVRLSFHDAGTFDAKKKTGGPNGSIKNELNDAPNGGLKFGFDVIEQVKAKHPKVTYADLIQLGGVVAIEVSGGPIIHFSPGRADALTKHDKTEGIPVPSGDAHHLRDVFFRMGLTDKDIVVLSGAHTLGRAHASVVGIDGPFTPNPLKFDNSYYVELLKGDNPNLVKFNTDKVLLLDPKFKPFVQHYAKDQAAFFKDYAESHRKMSELGFHPPPIKH